MNWQSLKVLNTIKKFRETWYRLLCKSELNWSLREKKLKLKLKCKQSITSLSMALHLGTMFIKKTESDKKQATVTLLNLLLCKSYTNIQRKDPLKPYNARNYLGIKATLMFRSHFQYSLRRRITVLEDFWKQSGTLTLILKCMKTEYIIWALLML